MPEIEDPTKVFKSKEDYEAYLFETTGERWKVLVWEPEGELIGSYEATRPTSPADR